MNLDTVHVLMPCRADALARGILAAYLYHEATFRAILSDRFQYPCGLWMAYLAGAVALTAWSPERNSTTNDFRRLFVARFFSCAVIMLLAPAKPSGPFATVMRMRGLRGLGRIYYPINIIHQALIYSVFYSFICAVFNGTANCSRSLSGDMD
jgi:peptidoglycan/LPS O-acetylase OafA/YrhL